MINTKKDRPDFGLECNKLLKKKNYSIFYPQKELFVTALLPLLRDTSEWRSPQQFWFHLHICLWEEAKGLYIDKLNLLVFVQVNRTIHKKRQTALY